MIGLSKHIREDIRTILLKNQLNYNSNHDFSATESDWLLDVVRKVYSSNFALFDLFSVQPLLANTGIVYYNNESELFSDIVETSFNKSKINFNIPIGTTDDVKAELAELLVSEFQFEIVRDLLYYARKTTNVYEWDFQSALGDTIMEKYESLYLKLVEASDIHDINWVVTSPEVASIFETATAGFAPHTDVFYQSSLGVRFIGTINNRWHVYKDPLFPVNTITMGRNSNIFDAGLVYSPYIPIMRSSDDKVIRQSFKKVVNEKCFANILIKNFVI